MVVHGAAAVCAHGTPFFLPFISTVEVNPAHAGVCDGQHRSRILDRGSKGGQARHQITAEGGRSLVICSFTSYVIMCLQSCMTRYEKISTMDPCITSYEAFSFLPVVSRLQWVVSI